MMSTGYFVLWLLVDFSAKDVVNFGRRPSPKVTVENMKLRGTRHWNPPDLKKYGHLDTLDMFITNFVSKHKEIITPGVVVLDDF